MPKVFSHDDDPTVGCDDSSHGLRFRHKGDGLGPSPSERLMRPAALRARWGRRLYGARSIAGFANRRALKTRFLERGQIAATYPHRNEANAARHLDSGHSLE
jgi:hypothetical protein